MKIQESDVGLKKKGTHRSFKRRHLTNSSLPVPKCEEYKFDLSVPAFQEKQRKGADATTTVSGPSVAVSYDWADQHSITWEAPIAGPNGGELPPGKCNMCAIATQ